MQASYLITGETRKYAHKTGGFRAVTPDRNFRSKDNGLGAWEVAIRYSTIDLNDGIVQGGQLDDVTLGLNWYLNFNTRVMFNYVMADLKGVGDVNIFQTRFQIFF